MGSHRILERFFFVATNVTRAPTSQRFCVCSRDTLQRTVGVPVYQLLQRRQVANSKRRLQSVEPACVEIMQFLKTVFSLEIRGELHYFKTGTWRETCKPAQIEKRALSEKETTFCKVLVLLSEQLLVNSWEFAPEVKSWDWDGHAQKFNSILHEVVLLLFCSASLLGSPTLPLI